MQDRMKTHQLTEKEINDLLEQEIVGRLATVGEGGVPYAVPVHYAYHNQKIYIHGASIGQKTDNIASNPNVCFEIDRFETFIMPAENFPCRVNTQYKSVIITGTAKLIEDEKEKTDALDLIVEKYTPLLSGISFGEAVKATAVIEISVKECTGKYYRNEREECKRLFLNNR